MAVRMATFSKRLRTAIDMRGISQTELAKKTGISKSSISHYLKGDWEGKQDAVYALALALNVSEAWLMGFDAKMERGNNLTAPQSTDDMDEINQIFASLSPDNRAKLVELGHLYLTSQHNSEEKK
ncbi:MAG: helix-turn-helix transcriptional regulator [Clostridium sp.]|jgi:transcriptional regulator with XRE-family HTH domain|nr:helix-turn-helix transcriptional regulator [Clostridium sp.]